MNGKTNYLSFLDLMCNSLGSAMLLLLLIASAGSQPETGQRNPMMLVRCYTEKGPRPEIRIEVKRPGRQNWERSKQIEKAFEFSATAEPTSGAESFVVIYDPAEGDWQFRAWVVSFAKDAPPGPIELKFSAEGDGVTLTPEIDAASRMVWPGDATPPARVVVRPVAEGAP